MVDTERPSNVRAIRAMFAEKEKTVIDALKKPKTISYEETNLDGYHPKSSALPLSTNEKICNDSQVTNKLSLASSSTSGTSPSMPLKPPVGPKPVCLKKSTVCLKKSPSVSSNISEFKNIVSQLEGSEGMYTSKSSINSSNNSPKVSSSQESIKSEENPPLTLLCDNITSNEGTQSKLIKKERLSLSNISNLESEREFNEVNLRKPSKAPPKPVRHSLISSNNYISKKREYRRKTLPTLEELGPAPAKPVRSSITVTMTNNGAPPLPERNDPTQETIASPPPLPDRILNGSRQLVVPPRPSSGPPKSVAKGPPNRPPPKTPDEPPLDEDLYCDTMDPERAQSLIAEYTEEEECGTRRNSILTRPMNPPPPPPTSQTSNNSMPSTTYDDYSHDTQGSSSGQDDIYEEMPCDLNKSPVYSNSKEQEKAEKQRKKDKKEKEKHQKMCEKLRKKYGLTGEEIPVDAGTVKSDCRGSKTDLTVHKGEMVLILRMESNPQGKWLAKNEKGKIGYVDLANIEVDADSVKSVMKVRVSQAIEEDVYSEIQTEDVYECTY